MSNMKKYLEIPVGEGMEPTTMCIDTWMYLSKGTGDEKVDTELYVHLTGGTHRIVITGVKLSSGQTSLKSILEDAMKEAYGTSWLKVSHPVVIPEKELSSGMVISSITMSILS